MISAEYLLSNPATVNRCIVLKIEEAFLPQTLTWLQEHQYFYVAFVRKLVFWICSKQKIIMKYLGDYFKNSDFNISGVKEQENYIGFRRVYHHYRMLKATGFLVRLFF